MDFQGATSVLVGYMIYHCECLMQGYLPRKLVLTCKRSEMEKTLWNPYRNCVAFTGFLCFLCFSCSDQNLSYVWLFVVFPPFLCFYLCSLVVHCPLFFLLWPSLVMYVFDLLNDVCLVFWWYVFLVFMFLIFLCFLICAYVSFFGAFLSHGVSQIIQVMNDHNLSIETNGDDWGSPILGNPHFRL